MYSPKIDESRIRKLYLLKISYAGLGMRRPMTEMVREALDDYLPKAEKQIMSAGGVLLKPEELEVRE